MTPPHPDHRRFFDLSIELLCVGDLEGRFVEVSPAWEKTLGYRAEEMVGRSFAEFLHPDDLAATRAETERLAAGATTVSFENRYRAKDGTYRWLQWTCAPDLSQGFLYAAARDVTEARHAAEALRASELRFRSVAETATDAIIAADAGGRIVSCNPRALAMFGYAESELLGQPLTLLMPERHQAAHRQGIQRVQETGQSRLAGKVVELEGRRRDGQEFPIELSLSTWKTGEGRFHGAIIRDITDRRRAQAALEAREEGLAITLNSVGDGLVATNAEGRIVRMNRVAEQLTGWTQAEASGRPFAEVVTLVDDETRAPIADPVARVLAEGTVVSVSGPAALITRDGSLRPIADSAAPILDATGRIAGVVVVFRDVAKDRQMQSRLLVSNRMASVGTLAAGVAHEINNPLYFVMSNLDFLTHELPLLRRRLAANEPRAELDRSIEEWQEAIADARQGAERVRNIVRDLKTFSRADEARLDAISPRQVLESTLNMAWNEIRHRARLVKEFGDTPSVMANESRIGQVFLNLVINAAQAIPEGHADGNEIRVVTRTASDGRALVEVHDTGAGIPPEIVNRIFDPFFTTKPVGMGTGLGLSICHSIVTAMGGEIGVESKPGRGSTFRVLLPAAPASRSETPAPRVAESIPDRRGRILIIDDDALVADGIRRNLTREHDVVAVTSGRQALEMLAAGEPFDVVLCDIMMPEVTGMDIHAELTRTAPRVAERVVFMTGGAFTPRMQEFLDTVPNRRFEKPFDVQELRGVIRERLR